MKTPGYEGEDPPPEEARRDYAGHVVAGRYRLEVLLGRGGMGHVYRAQHLELEEPVVVKLIDPAYAQDPTARARFRREAKALIRLRHPGIVTMHEFGEHEGTLFLVMELVEGRTLGARLDLRDAPLALVAVHDIFAQIGDALAATHAAGIVHRDIKPDNVMLVPRPAATGAAARAILMDFGLARLGETREVGVSTTGMVVGTPSYMSPEQCYGTDAGPPSDVYSTGVMLFEALAGHRPFDSETATVVMSQHMFVTPPKLERMASGELVPPGLVGLVEDMLAKKPEARPTASQLVRRLGEIRTGTDALGFGAAATERRLVEVMKSRDERALPGLPTVPLGAAARLSSEATLLAAPAEAERPLVLVHACEGERASHLVASLAIGGITARVGDSLSRLRSAAKGDALTAIIVCDSNTPATAEAVRAIRGTPGYATLPVLVADVREANGIAELIRAGASDVALSILGDDAVVTKTWRLIRRKR